MRVVRVAVVLAVIAVSDGVPTTRRVHANGVKRPLGLDLYRPVPDNNPLTPAKVDLGRRLFRDRRLSRDESMACANCHDPRRAFTNGETVARGVGGARGTRNVPTIVNRAWGRSFFWGGRAPTLEDQVLLPILHPDELAMTAARVVALAQSEPYRRRFADAFAQPPALATASKPNSGDVTDPYAGLNAADALTLRRVALALAAYVRTIQAGDSPYHRYITGDRSALNVSARRGLEIFRGQGRLHRLPSRTDLFGRGVSQHWRRLAHRCAHRRGPCARDQDRPRSRRVQDSHAS